MTDFGRYINLKSGFSYPTTDPSVPVHFYDASLILKPKT